MSNTSSPFQKRVLIPFWVLRLGLMLILIGIYAWAIAVFSSVSNSDIEDATGDNVSDSEVDTARGVAIGVLGAFLFLLVVCFILDIVAIILFARHNLRPKVFLIFNVLQTLFWTIMLILSIVGAANSRAPGGVVFTVIIFLLFLGLLIYASVIYHRDRKGRNRGGYQQTPNPGLYESQPVDFQHQPYNPNSTYSGAPDVHNQPAAATEYYSVPTPPTYFNPSTTPQPQQYQAYSGQKSVPQDAAYELPERGNTYQMH